MLSGCSQCEDFDEFTEHDCGDAEFMFRDTLDRLTNELVSSVAVLAGDGSEVSKLRVYEARDALRSFVVRSSMNWEV